MPDYNASRTTALNLIRKFGSNRKVGLLRRTEASYDPVTDIETGPTEVRHDVYGVMTPGPVLTPTDTLSVGERRQLYLPATGLPVTPLPGDRVMVLADPAPWVITEVSTMAPDGDAIYHTCQMQRGGGGGP